MYMLIKLYYRFMLDFPNAEVKNGFVSGNIFNNTAFPTLNHFIVVVIKTKM